MISSIKPVKIDSIDQLIEQKDIKIIICKEQAGYNKYIDLFKSLGERVISISFGEFFDLNIVANIIENNMVLISDTGTIRIIAKSNPGNHLYQSADDNVKYFYGYVIRKNLDDFFKIKFSKM